MNETIKVLKNHNFNKDQKILKAMKTFAYTANVPITLYDDDMNVLWECHPELRMCTLFMNHGIRNCQCNANLERAVAEAKRMRKPYIFMCASGFTEITYPIEEDSLKGTIIVGPIIMGKNRESALNHIFKYLPDFRDYVNELLALIEANRTRTSMEVSCIYEVFCDCIFSHRLLENSTISQDYFITDGDLTMTEYGGKSDIIRAAIQYLQDNYMKEVELKALSEAVHVNASYLSSLFKKETAMTFSQNLNMIRLNQSVGLLRTTDLPLEEIAKCCGFSSKSYFIRIFKQYYNETPGRYRRVSLNKG